MLSNLVATVGSTKWKNAFVDCSTIPSIKVEVTFPYRTRTVRVRVPLGSDVPKDTAGQAAPVLFLRSPDPSGVTPRIPRAKSPVRTIEIVTGVGGVRVRVAFSSFFVGNKSDLVVKSDYGRFFISSLTGKETSFYKALRKKKNEG